MRLVVKKAIYQLARAQGIRISSKSVDFLDEYLNEKVIDILTKALDIAHYAGRKTVRPEDIKFVLNYQVRDIDEINEKHE